MSSVTIGLLPINAPSPPQQRLIIAAPDYAPTNLQLDDLLFAQTHRTGKAAQTVGEATVEIVIVTYRVILGKE